MRTVEDRCVGCTSLGMHCIGSSCRTRNVEVYYCDKCGEELEEIYDVDGQELCEECLKEMFIRD